MKTDNKAELSPLISGSRKTAGELRANQVETSENLSLTYNEHAASMPVNEEEKRTVLHLKITVCSVNRSDVNRVCFNFFKNKS